jgi:hypothetical protein
MFALWFVGAAIEMSQRLGGCSNHLYFSAAFGPNLECYLSSPSTLWSVLGGIFGFIGLASLTHCHELKLLFWRLCSERMERNTATQ